MTKNDYVILDDKQELEGLEKLKNIIMILNDKNLKIARKKRSQRQVQR